MAVFNGSAVAPVMQTRRAGGSNASVSPSFSQGTGIRRRCCRRTFPGGGSRQRQRCHHCMRVLEHAEAADLFYDYRFKLGNGFACDDVEPLSVVRSNYLSSSSAIIMKTSDPVWQPPVIRITLAGVIISTWIDSTASAVHQRMLLITW